MDALGKAGTYRDARGCDRQKNFRNRALVDRLLTVPRHAKPPRLCRVLVSCPSDS